MLRCSAKETEGELGISSCHCRQRYRGIDFGKAKAGERTRWAGKRAKGPSPLVECALERNPIGGTNTRTFPNKDVFIYLQ